MQQHESNFYIRIVPAVIGFGILAYYDIWLFWAGLLITASVLMWIEVKWQRLKNRIWHSEKKTENKLEKNN